MEPEQYKIILNAFIARLFIEQWDILSEEKKQHLCNIVDYSLVPDRYVNSDYKKNYIQWHRVDKMQAIRLATRDLSVINLIDFKKFKYSLKEVYYLVKNNNELMSGVLQIDFENMPYSDVVIALCFGNYDIKNKINLQKYQFSFTDILSIIRAFKYDVNMIKELDYKKLKGHQIAEILANTEEEVAELFDINILNKLDWLYLLEKEPRFIKRCDLQKFIEGDPYDIICLASLFYGKLDLYYLLDNIDYKSISAYGWEKLLIVNPEKFIDKCDFSKLNEANWENIKITRPELLAYKKLI